MSTPTSLTKAAAHPTAGPRPGSAVAWFAAMVGGWLAFGTGLLFSADTLGDLWHWVRELPLVLEGLVWLAAFPFVLALGIWESAWAGGVRLALVGCCAVGWSLAFWPRRRRPDGKAATPAR